MSLAARWSAINITREDNLLKSHHQLARAIAASICAVGLTACGGGGGGGSASSTEPTMLGITAGNSEVVGRAAVSSAYSLQLTSGTFVGADVSPNPQLLKSIVDAVRHGMQFVGERPQLLTGVASTYSYQCDAGGSFDFTVDDKNGNGIMDAGDSFILDFKSCKSAAGGMGFGRISVAVQAMSGQYLGSAYNTTMSVTVTGYGLLFSDGLSVQGDGDFNLSFGLTAAGIADMTLATNRFTILGNSSSLHYTSTLTGAVLTQHTEMVAGHQQVSTTFTGKVAGSELGSQQVSISTPQPLLSVDGELFYSGGQLLIRGAANSVLRMTPFDRYQVRLELDADGNGSYESQQLKYWLDLL